MLELAGGLRVRLIDLPAMLLNMAGLTLDEARVRTCGADICSLFPILEAA